MATQTTSTAQSFLKTIGINTHSGFSGGAYENSSLVLKSLNYIGVNLVRDAFVSVGTAAPVVEALAAGGVKFDFVVSSLLPGRGADALADYVKGLQALEEKHPGSIFAVEGLNEANIRDFSYNGSGSMAAAGAFQKALYEAIKANGTLSKVSVINLSLGNEELAAYKALGDLGSYSDYANVHAYTHTSGSADATMEYQISLAQKASSGDPVIVTEIGYTTLETFNYLGVSEKAQAKLLLDNLLNAYENGSTKTFLYELFDQDSDKSNAHSEMHFGIFNDDGTPKLAATALHNLTTILSHEGAGTGGSGAAAVQFTGLPSGSHSMTLAKANGVYDVVLWTDALVWDDKADKDIVNASTSVTVKLGSVQANVYVYDPLQSQTPIAVYHNVSEIQVPLSDSPVIIEVGAAEPITTPVAGDAANPNPSMTAAEFVASVDALAAAGNIQSITLTDGHTLKVSSVSTMQHMIEHDAAILSKITGGYDFVVDYGQAAWRKVTSYDAKGTVQSTTDYSLKDGAVLSKTTVNADGSRFSISYKKDVPTISREVTKDGTNITTNYDASGKLANVYSEKAGGDKSTTLYTNGVKTSMTLIHNDGSKEFHAFNLTGRSYTTQVQVLDAKGAVISVTRSHADGTLDYTELNKSDGSKTLTYYNAKGAKLTEATTTAAGTKTTLTYDATTAKLTAETMTAKNGDASSTTYVNGVKSAMTLTHADGSKEFYAYNLTGRSYTTQVQVVDAKGAVVSVTRSHADGSLDYTEVYKTGGAKTLTYYDAKGVKLTEATTGADGSKTTLSFDATTAKLAKSIVTTAGGDVTTTVYSGGVKLSETVSIKGGGNTYKTYDTLTGKLTLESKTFPDGSKSDTQYVNGVAKAVNITHADGGTENYAYGITGKTYATQHQVFDKAGKLLSLERSRADGTMESTETYKTDGTKIFSTFDTAGHKQSVVTVETSGTRTSLTYETSGALAKEYIQSASGDTQTTVYTAGVKTAMTLAHADGSVDQYAYNLTGRSYTTQHQTLDASGKVVSLVRAHADGSLDYTETYAKDGSKAMSVYDAKGALLTVTSVSADGSRAIDTYLQDGTKDVRHELFNGAKVLQVTDLQHADGTHTIWAQADNQTLTGSAGNDIFHLFANNETVRFTGGHDTIYSFDVSRPDLDHIVISKSLADHFSDLSLKQVGGDVLVQIDGGNSILLVGTQVAQVTSEFFAFT